MKNQLLLLLICLLPFGKKAFSQNSFPSSGSAGVGTALPDASSLFEVKSTSKGILIPRMTKTQRDAIAAPATGLLIYQTNSTPAFYYFDGSVWKKIISSAGANTKLSNLAATTVINVPLLPDTNNTKNLGSGASSWKDIYADGKFYLDDIPFISNINDNVLMGQDAGNGITIGDANTAVGNKAMYNVNGGSNNTAVGHRALFSGGTGSNNVALGPFALYHNAASYNHAFGYEALYENTTGEMNVATGYKSLPHNTTGNSNIAIGHNAMFENRTGSSNIAIGKGALYSNWSGDQLIAIGDSSLYNNGGEGNLAIGFHALSSNTGGELNIALGHSALFRNTNGLFNCALGVMAMYESTTGNGCSAFGCYSLYSNTTGTYNVAVGTFALYKNTTGNQNTALGAAALDSNDTGTGNTALGYDSGSRNDADTNCVFIGRDADQSVTFDFTNSMAAGYTSRITASNQVRIGNSIVSSIGGYANWSNLSDGNFKKNIKENVPGLDFINKLRPITYTVDVTKLNKFIYRNDTVDFDERSLKNKEAEIQTGFVAQEVEQAAKSSGYDFSGVDKPKNADDLYGLRYAEFVVPLVKSVQELSIQNEALKKENVEIRAQLNAMQECLQSLCQSQQRNLNAEKIKSKITLSVQPNPAHDVAVITVQHGNDESENLNIKISDVSAKVLQQYQTSGNYISSFELNTSTFARGTYLVQLFNQSELLQTQKLIVQ